MSAKEIVRDLMPVLEAAQTDGTYLLAVAKLDALLQGKSPISRNTVRAAVGLPAEIARRCEAFIAEPGFKPVKLEMPGVDLRELSIVLFEEIDAEWLAARLGDVSDVEQESFAAALGAALAHLQERLPKVPVSRRSRLSDMESSRFARVYRTVSNPMTVLDDLEMGCLSRSQVETLMAVFPVLHQAMVLGITSAAADALAKDEEFLLPWPKLKQVAVLTLSPTVPADLQGVLQGNFAREDAATAPQSGGSVNLAQAMSTPSQKLEGR
jgi:hypothetical protein